MARSHHNVSNEARFPAGRTVGWRLAVLENMNDCLPAIPMLLILRHKLSQSAYKISPCTNKRTRFSAGNPMYRGSPLLDISSSKILQHHTVYARLTAINYTRGLASHRTKVLAVQDAVGAAGFVVETCSCAGRGTLCPTALGAIEGGQQATPLSLEPSKPANPLLHFEPGAAIVLWRRGRGKRGRVKHGKYMYYIPCPPTRFGTLRQRLR